jgi:hypothetical protein
MIKRYTLENKPKFKDGDLVLVDMDVMGTAPLGILRGKIVGKGTEHIIDMWLVEFEQNFAPTYPFKVVSIIHTAFIESSPVETTIRALAALVAK